MQNARLDEAQLGIKIAGKNINNIKYADDITLMTESEEELKSLLMKVKEERGFSRVTAGFSSYDGEYRLPLVLAQASPIFHSSCEGKLGIALE